MPLKVITFILFCQLMWQSLSAEESFLLLDASKDKWICEMGSRLDERATPCSTFKIALCLMGFDSGVLEDSENPTWSYQDGYDDFLDSWKMPQTPRSWIKQSCIWYSQVLVDKMGGDSLQRYLEQLNYGNRDISGETESVWVNSSLKISPREQVDFIRKLVKQALPASHYAHQMTKEVLFVEKLPDGWELYGKTGWGGSRKDDSETTEIAWFVGWFEKAGATFPFAYQIRDDKIALNQRVPRVKELFTSLITAGHESPMLTGI